jgi:hypothetical protein
MTFGERLLREPGKQTRGPIDRWLSVVGLGALAQQRPHFLPLRNPRRPFLSVRLGPLRDLLQSDAVLDRLAEHRDAEACELCAFVDQRCDHEGLPHFAD